jgi:hypothetical protein
LSQNSVPPSPTQGLTNQATIDFLEGLGLPLDQLWLAWSITHANGKSGWRTARYSRAVVAAMPANQRHHVSSGLYPPGVAKRDDHKDLLGVWCICFDDVGDMTVIDPTTGEAISHLDIGLFEVCLLPQETWSMETSAGNHQFVFQFDPVLTSAEAVILIDLLKLRYGNGVIHSRGQYLRTPTGINSKRGNVLFPTKFRTKDGPKYTYASFLDALGVSPDDVKRVASGLRQKARGSSETCSEETMKAILDALDPNDGLVFKSRDEWIGIAHAVQNTLGEAGEDLFLDWSSRYTGYIKSSGEALRIWETLGGHHRNDLGSLRSYLISTHGEKSDIFKELQQRITDEQAPLTVVDPNDPAIPSPSPTVSPDTRKDEAAKKRFDALLKEARKLADVPDQHAGDEDENWLGKDGRPVGIMANIDAPQTELPTIFAPYAKGQMSMLAGPPGKGKSLLALSQSMAVIYDDAKLVRGGKDGLSFAGDVFYVCNEDALSVLQRRAQAFVKSHKLGKAKHDLFPVRSMLLSKNGDTTTIECLRVVEAMVEHLRGGRKIARVVIDTMPASLVGIEENSTKEMSEVLSLMRRIATAFWCDVTVIHHSTKVAWDKPDEARSLASLLRGSGASGGSVRAAVGLLDLTAAEMGNPNNNLTSTKKLVAEWIAKANDGEQNYVPAFYEITTIDIDVRDKETGKIVQRAAPVLIYHGSPAAAAFSGSLTPAQEQDALDKLRAARRKGEQVRVYGLGAKGKNLGDDGVHKVLGVTNPAAHAILGALEKRGMIEVKEGRTASGNECDIVVLKDEADDETGPF